MNLLRRLWRLEGTVDRKTYILGGAIGFAVKFAYRHRLWPSAYWRLWSDAIIHRIHMRVLRHIDRETTSRPAKVPGRHF